MLSVIGGAVFGFLKSSWAKIAGYLGMAAAFLFIFMQIKQMGKDEANTAVYKQDHKNAQDYKEIEQSVVTANPSDVDKRLQPFYRD